LPVLIILLVVGSALVGYLGRRRRIGFLGFFLFSLLLTPLLCLLILLLTQEKRRHPVETTSLRGAIHDI
jgi:hypothetical protein